VLLALLSSADAAARIAMSDMKPLHDTDFFAWSKAQAEALRTEARIGSNQKLDWENLAEEIEDLGVSQLSALESQVRRIIEHFLKLENSPASGPRRGWRESIVDARVEIEVLLDRNPSLSAGIAAIVSVEHSRAARKAIAGLQRYRELEPSLAARIRATVYTAEQILGDWLPPEPTVPRAEQP
jgi:hypothetical protein